jgi:hypothetical protein
MYLIRQRRYEVGFSELLPIIVRHSSTLLNKNNILIFWSRYQQKHLDKHIYLVIITVVTYHQQSHLLPNHRQLDLIFSAIISFVKKVANTFLICGRESECSMKAALSSALTLLLLLCLPIFLGTSGSLTFDLKNVRQC